MSTRPRDGCGTGPSLWSTRSPRKPPADRNLRAEPMKTPSLDSFRWLDVAAAWRPREDDRLELWLPRDWPGTDTELRWRRTEPGGAVRQGSQRGLEGLASAGEVVVWTPAAETLLLRARRTGAGAPRAGHAVPAARRSRLDARVPRRRDGAALRPSRRIRRSARVAASGLAAHRARRGAGRGQGA